MMELLIAKGADLNEDLLLHGVARSGQEKAVEFLISKGLNANVKDNSGATPLHWQVLETQQAKTPRRS